MKNIISPGFLTLFLLATLTGFMMGKKFDLVNTVSGLMNGALAPQTGQHNLLLIGTNQIDSSETELQSVWLLIYFTDKPEITLLPIFPDPNRSIPNNQRLSQAFQLNSNLEPRPEFWQALHDTTSTWWDGYILIDELAAIAIADTINTGVPGSSRQRSSQLIASIQPWRQDTQANLAQQTAFLAGLCESFSTGAPDIDLEALLQIASTDLKTNLDARQMLADWLTIVQMEQLTCRMPLSEQPGYQSFELQPGN
ncbi:MAG: hypothetical protein JW862_02770 [Anaerolineales bacterium]|nr:hypothetical protein [Anaerolineales bacterium]